MRLTIIAGAAVVMMIAVLHQRQLIQDYDPLLAAEQRLDQAAA